MWLSAIKLAVSAGSKIYANKQRTKMAMSDAQLMHADHVWPEGDEAYQGKLLEARQSDWKDEAVLIILSDCPYSSAGLGGRIGRSGSDGQGKIVFRHVLAASELVHKFVDPCRGEYLWYKGNTNI
jgi:hypothetical protein